MDVKLSAWSIHILESGGDTWNTLHENKDEAGFFDSIAFWDEHNGLLLGDPVDDFYVVKKTTDGGKTWRRIEQTHLPEKLDKEAAFAASGNTLIVGKNGKAWLTTGGHSASDFCQELADSRPACFYTVLFGKTKNQDIHISS